MVYIGTSQEQGQAIYFDIHAIRKVRQGLEVCGTVGDGCYEGEVLVECGAVDEVTFADAWLGGEGLPGFLGRCDEVWLRGALIEAARGSLGEMARPKPHRPGRRRGAGSVAEAGPVWGAAATALQ